MSILKTYYLLSKPVLDYVSLIFLCNQFSEVKDGEKDYSVIVQGFSQPWLVL